MKEEKTVPRAFHNGGRRRSAAIVASITTLRHKLEQPKDSNCAHDRLSHPLCQSTAAFGAPVRMIFSPRMKRFHTVAEDRYSRLDIPNTCTSMRDTGMQGLRS